MEGPLIPANFLGQVKAVGGSSTGNNVANIPREILALVKNGLIDGLVVNRSLSGDTIVQTAKGNFTFNSQINLPLGASLSFRLLGEGKNLQLKLVNVNNQPISNFIPKDVPASAIKDTIHLQSNGISAAPPKNITSSYNNMLSQEIGSSSNNPQTKQLNSSNAVTESITNLNIGRNIGMVMVKPEPAMINIIINRLQNIKNPSSQNLEHLKSPGAKLVIQLTQNISFPDISQTDIESEIDHPTMQSLPKDPSSLEDIEKDLGEVKIFATVIGKEKSGEVVLNSSLGTLKLEQDIELPKDTKLIGKILEIVSIDDIAKLDLSNTESGKMKIINSFWSGIGDILEVLDEEAPQILQKFINEKMPIIADEKNLATKINNFANHAITGNFEDWLGAEVIKTLKNSDKKELVDEIKKSFDQVANIFAEKQEIKNNWQMMLVPFLADEQIKTARFFVKNFQEENEHKHSHSEGSRFVVEIELEETGPIQLDGLIRKAENNISFDMVIRSQKEFSDESRSNIINIYSDIMLASGYKGMISFQIAKDFPINPLLEFAENSDIIWA